MGCCGAKMQKNQGNRKDRERNREAGNVILWILVAIILFGALNFIFSKGFRSGATTISDEKASLIASEIFEYTRTVKQTVHLLQINGCRDTEISFDQTVVAGYSNPNSPADETCNVFAPAGGGLTWKDPPQNASNYANFEMIYNARIQEVGTDPDPDGTDLIMVLPELNEDVCKKINEKVGIDLVSGNVPPDSGDIVDVSWPGRFVGVYGPRTNSVNGPSNNCSGADNYFCGQATACFHEAGGGQYFVFYHVLIAR